MKPLLKALEPLEAFRGLMRAEARGEYAGISGAAQICRSHMIAACCAAGRRSAVVLCQDDLAANRTARELEALLGTPPAVLPARELTLLGSQIKQSVISEVKNSIRGLARLKENGYKVGALKFKSVCNSVDLKQYHVTYDIDKDRSRVRIQNIRSIVSHYRIAAVFWIPVEDAYRPTWTYSQAVLTTPAGMILIRYGTATMIFFVEIQQLTGTDFDTAAAADAELVIYFKFCNIDHSLKKPAVHFQRCRYI